MLEIRETKRAVWKSLKWKKTRLFMLIIMQIKLFVCNICLSILPYWSKTELKSLQITQNGIKQIQIQIPIHFGLNVLHYDISLDCSIELICIMFLDYNWRGKESWKKISTLSDLRTNSGPDWNFYISTSGVWILFLGPNL